MNSSDEFWTINGVSLHQQGWSVTTVGGTRYAVPPLRGDNPRSAYTIGEQFVQKVVDARTISLPMFLIGADPATGRPVGDSTRRWNDSWAFLRQLFWNPDAQMVLGRRWWRTDPVAGPGIAFAEARAQLAPGADLQPTMTGRTRATFTADLRLADPFFYGPEISTGHLQVGQSATVVNPGDYNAFTKNVYVELHGPLSGVRVTNTTPHFAIYCGLTGSIAGNEVITLDVATFIARAVKAGVIRNRTGEIYQSANRPWMSLLRGANTIKLTGTGGGYAVLRFRPPYL